MTKKDYVKVAAIVAKLFKKGRPGYDGMLYIDHAVLVKQLSAMFRRDNGRFDREKFEAACKGDIPNHS